MKSALFITTSFCPLLSSTYRFKAINTLILSTLQSMVLTMMVSCLPVHIKMITAINNCIVDLFWKSKKRSFTSWQAKIKDQANAKSISNENPWSVSLCFLPCNTLACLWMVMFCRLYWTGKLIGRFYDENGRQTAEKDKYDQLLKQAAKEKLEKNEYMKLYPPCNSEYAKSAARVWCSNKR